MKILAIDTSCDETSVAVVEDDRVISNQLSSQIQSHQEWGGVVPSLAKRKHEELIDFVIQKALKQARVSLEDIDVFAVTQGPGLAIALEVGIKKAKELALKYEKPLVPVNHMEGHIYSTLAKNSKGKPEIVYEFPLLALLVSGGHTEFVVMRGHGQYEIVGQTLDDAIGEAFDKVGRMLDLGYPAGPVIERLAKEGDENRYMLPIPMIHSGDGNMSYSGLKTAAMKLVNQELDPMNKYGEKFKNQVQSSFSLQRSNNSAGASGQTPVQGNLNPEDQSVRTSDRMSNKINQHNPNPEKQIICDISASFQKAAVNQVLIKTEVVLKKLNKDFDLNVKDLIIGGGVAQNLYLRKKFRAKFGKELRIHYPKSKKLYTDNAGMIGVAGYFNVLNKKYCHNLEKLDRIPNLTFIAQN